jgi:hypothetical protein
MGLLEFIVVTFHCTLQEVLGIRYNTYALANASFNMMIARTVNEYF